MEKNTVLSLSPSQEALAKREATLRSGGLKVISVLSPIRQGLKSRWAGVEFS